MFFLKKSNIDLIAEIIFSIPLPFSFFLISRLGFILMILKP